MSGVDAADAALIGKAVADAVAPRFDAIEQKYTVADNRADAQSAAYFATGHAWAAKRFAEGADFETVFNEVWARFRPLWAQS